MDQQKDSLLGWNGFHDETTLDPLIPDRVNYMQYSLIRDVENQFILDCWNNV